MKRISLSNETKDVLINEECELSIVNSKTKITFSKLVKKVFIDKIIDSEIVFDIDHSMEVAIVNQNETTSSKINYDLSNLNTHLLIRTLCLVANNNKFIEKVLVSHNDKSTFCDFKFLGFSFGNAYLEIRANNWIKPNMSGSESHQLLKVITSENGVAKTEPGLIIDNYDVKASHGNSIGQFDVDTIYYLQTRGLNKKQAQLLIIKGQVDSILKSFDKQYAEKIKTAIITEYGGING